MSDDTAKVTLHQLMTMSGGFPSSSPAGSPGPTLRSRVATTSTSC